MYETPLGILTIRRTKDIIRVIDGTGQVSGHILNPRIVAIGTDDPF